MKIQNDVKIDLINLTKVFSFSFLIMVFLIQGCASPENKINSKVLSIDGLIVEVESQSLVEVSSITVVDRSGEEYMLYLEGNYGPFTPSHLREHMIAAVPISVEYIVTDEKWNVIAIYDDSDSNQNE
ncbi:hypothetical protein M1N90_02585 [Dehalococcoidia bacterium]|nr:hypothetical protein [Dehalococcoidia bacterium]